MKSHDHEGLQFSFKSFQISSTSDWTFEEASHWTVRYENDPELISWNLFEYDLIKQPNRMDQSEIHF